MTHPRAILFSVAFAALLLCAAPALAGTGSPDVPPGTAAPALAPAIGSSQCTQPAQETATAAMAAITAIGAIGATPAPDSGLFLSAPPSDPDFILCTCKFCRNHPDVICRISPTGFSILCSDYYASHCG